MQPVKLLIGSDWITTSQTQEIIDPFTGELVATVALGDRALLERAIEVAHAAFTKTRTQAPYERANLLHAVAQGIEQRREEFVNLLIREAGKPHLYAQAEVTRAVITFESSAEEARHLSGQLLDINGYAVGKGHLGFTQRFPIGVIAAITPFNFPLNLVAHKVAPCLATGNAMVLKPAIKTPLCACLLGEVLLAAGMILGQVNIVTSSNADAAVLSSHDLVKMVSFTGSPDVGWKIKSQATKKKVCLELGGNAAVIVHDDADFTLAIPTIAAGSFAYAGQSCISVQRILVQNSRYEEFKAAFLKHVQEKIKCGDPRHTDTILGPMINLEARERIEGWIQEAVQAGAKVLHGATIEEGCLLPTVLENVPRAQKIYAQEAFAPVVVLETYQTFQEALHLVNDSDFGLQTGIYTNSLDRALLAFQQLDVGGVLINNVPTFRVETMPYGGVKDSGFGREGVRYTMEEMTELKSLIIQSTAIP